MDAPAPGADFKAKFLGHAQKHQDFIFAVAVRVHVALALEHFNKRLEFQVAAGRDEIFLARGRAFVVIVPGFLVIAGLAESATNGFLDAHARGRIPSGLAGDAEVRTLGIFAESKLDPGHGALKGKFRCRLAPA